MLAKRNSGVDYLRVIAAVMVVSIHMCNRLYLGDENTTIFGRMIYYFLYAILLCAVNIFGIVSGYVGYNEKNCTLRIDKLLIYWIEFFVYGGVFYALALICGFKQFRLKEFIFIFFPITSESNWYMTAYFVLLFVAPILNLYIQKHTMNSNRNSLCMICVAVLYCFLANIANHDVLFLRNGYSWVWLALLYYTGASCKKWNWLSAIRERNCLVLICSIPAGMMLIRVFAPLIMEPLFGFTMGDRSLYCYISPTVVLLSVSICALLLKANIDSQFISKVSQTTLGIFIIHTVAFDDFIVPLFSWTSQIKEFLFPIIVLIESLLISIICSLIDGARITLFEKVGIKKKVEEITYSLERTFREKEEE